jgi:hypothetical protein
MRNYINLLETALNEGVGLSNRRAGEQFKNKEGDVITFQDLNFYPESGRFESPDQAFQAVADVAKKLGIPEEMIAWTNSPRARLGGEGAAHGGFGVAHFTDEAGKDYYLGRWFQNISPNRSQNNFPHDAIPGGFKFASKSGAKENTGYKPSEVLKTYQSNTPASIVEQIVTKFGPDSAEAEAVRTFIKAEEFPVTFPKGTINFTAFRDYFCEMLQPIALVLGKPVKGNAGEAAEIFFGAGNSFNGCVISFNDSVTGGLFDSLLVSADGKQIKLSSKGKNGANASVVNLLRSVKELEVAPKGKQLVKKHAEAISILQIIDDAGHVGAPLKLGVLYDIISADSIPTILQLKAKGPNDQLNWGKEKDLEKLYNSRKPKDWSRVIPLEHMLSAIAYKVADHVNKNTNFGQAASEILNHSALVQMYTEASETKDTISITGFTAVYPSETVTGVVLDASKAYMSTQGKGNFTFKILKNGASEKDMDLTNIETDTKPDPGPDGVVNYQPARTNIKAADTKQKAPDDVEALGRKRRKSF